MNNFVKTEEYLLKALEEVKKEQSIIENLLTTIQTNEPTQHDLQEIMRVLGRYVKEDTSKVDKEEIFPHVDLEYVRKIRNK